MFWKKIFFASVILFIGMFALPKITHAQVVINEFSSSTSDDWVELYAYEDTDISGWILDDYNTDTNMKVIPQGTVIGPSTSNFYIVDCSNRLNVTGDIITLFKSDLTQIDQVLYGDKGGVCIPSDVGSIARIPDGGNTYDRLSLATKGMTNGNSFTDPCPTPTPIPTNTPTNTPTPTDSPVNTPTNKLTNTPTPSNTSTPTPKPTATKTPTPTSTKKLSPTPSSSENLLNTGSGTESGDVLSLETNRDFLTITPTPGGEENKSNNSFPIIAVLFIVMGLGFIVFAGVMMVKMRKQEV